MRFFSLFLSMLILSAVMSAQKRYLVSPREEVIPLEQGKSASSSIKDWKQRMSSSRNGVCTDKFYFGYPESVYPPANGFIARHRDVMGLWFTAKATGTIDSLFWEMRNPIGVHDSTMYLRIHESNIGPSYGPGIRPGPWGPPCQNWGYWVNTDDLDQGVAAFLEESTDPTWISTINSPVPSGPPFGAEIWGFGGVEVILKPDTLNSYDLAVLGTPNITVGDRFFVSLRSGFNPSLPAGGHIDETVEVNTIFGTSAFRVTTADEDYPARNWKFYEHDKGPSNCAGIPTVDVKRGWVNRGGYTEDTLDVAAWNWYYAMTVTSNVPPIIEDQTDLHTTFSTGTQVLTAVITDCNPANIGNAGVASAIVRYSVNDVAQADIAMGPIGGDIFEATLPGQPAGSDISWKIIATDLDAAVAQGPPDNYSVVSYGTEWFSIDTGYACVTHDISVSGTAIDTSQWFVPFYTNSGTAPKDDGTAGPFDMGDDYVLFGDNFRYAWVGVNGAIALSKSATDTLDVNANGFATTVWNFPGAQHYGRPDTFGVNSIPPMFVAPFWADHLVWDSAGGLYGRILYGNDADTCLFIVQWDSVGAFDTDGSVPDITTFRVVLNRCTGVVEYQYESVGTYGLDSAALVGLQADSSAISGPNPGYLFYNRLGYPIETRPYDNTCIRFYPKVATAAIDGWNIVAVSTTPNNAIYSKAALFPTAISPAYRYAAGYTVADPLIKGEGYWLKFSGNNGVGTSPSTFDHDVTATVVNGWNLVGGPSGYVLTGSIIATGGVPSPNYFAYGPSGYYTASSIQPGKGVWVKMSGAGTLQMISYAAAPKADPMIAGETDLATLNSVIISDASGRSQTLYLGSEGQMRTELSFFELPPVPPAGSYDVRFSSQRMVESYPEAPVDGQLYEYPISIQGATYPVIVRWDVNSPVKGARKMVLSDIVDGKSIQQIMDGSGSVMIKNQNVKSVVIRLSESVNVPASFALSQNYPNPFNPVTHFTVDLPKTTEVEVAIYDLLGRKIASLLNGNQPAGQYTLEWNGRDGNGMVVPTGLYFLRMSSDEFNAARKIMLMK